MSWGVLSASNWPMEMTIQIFMTFLGESKVKSIYVLWFKEKAKSGPPTNLTWVCPKPVVPLLMKAYFNKATWLLDTTVQVHNYHRFFLHVHRSSHLTPTDFIVWSFSQCMFLMHTAQCKEGICFLSTVHNVEQILTVTFPPR